MVNCSTWSEDAGRSDAGGGGVSVVNGATLVMEGGSTISDCYCGGDGAGVMVQGAYFYMYGASSIRRCVAKGRGGGLLAEEAAMVHISEDSVIAECHSKERGGGIEQLPLSQIVFEGGSIQACRSAPSSL